ncbi:unnamed protein product [Calypogeia fissa]
MAAAAESLVEFSKKDKRRLLHVVYRVGNLERTIQFYTEVLGMKLLRKRDIPQEKYTNAFLGYGPEDTHFLVELTYNMGRTPMTSAPGSGTLALLWKTSRRSWTSPKRQERPSLGNEAQLQASPAR